MCMWILELYIYIVWTIFCIEIMNAWAMECICFHTAFGYCHQLNSRPQLLLYNLSSFLLHLWGFWRITFIFFHITPNHSKYYTMILSYYYQQKKYTYIYILDWGILWHEHPIKLSFPCLPFAILIIHGPQFPPVHTWERVKWKQRHAILEWETCMVGLVRGSTPNWSLSQLILL